MRSFSTEHFGLRGRLRLTFSKRVRNFGTRLFQNGRKKTKKIRNGRHPTVFRNSLTKNDARRVRNVMEALRTPKTAITKIKIRDFGVSGVQGGPPPVPYFSTIRTSVFLSVGSAAWAKPAVNPPRCKVFYSTTA